MKKRWDRSVSGNSQCSTIASSIIHILTFIEGKNYILNNIKSRGQWNWTLQVQKMVSLCNAITSLFTTIVTRTHAHTEKGETHLINKYNDRSQLAGKGEESLCELFSISKPLSQETGNRKLLSNIQKQKTMTTQTENARLYQLSMI